jgi:hypothetical protein
MISWIPDRARFAGLSGMTDLIRDLSTVLSMVKQ